MVQQLVTPQLDIICNSRSALPAAQQLAASTDLPLLVDAEVGGRQRAEYALLFDAQGVSLVQGGPGAAGAVRADFVGGQVNHRRRYGGGKGQLIARAVGIKAARRPAVMDATAGLGRDAFVLATLGCEVLLLERSPIVHALLADGLERAHNEAQSDGGLAEILARMSLHFGCAQTYLQALPDTARPDVVYLDPMFPEREKSASVKKEMRAFHSVVGRDLDAGALLTVALERAGYRVVVKRPRKSPPIAGRSPSFVLEGKSSRYDIYALRKMDT
ncbi:class I SAM-dependent methyltransferase [Exilibacterium tricleocarpae]|uniref:Ribosomal RNA small subunit methyltransferase J n=1 Tax=Exilibacterium tricleocarpae TaxID=2591008 RepID=A0A545U840_9GAMM|nr:class I SAM-dependent methyltransferase [Exilibacterium tricleocarpae]TQV85634.1 class I SAM-dependent methyltransferase [Exilibacterium tricleocarpae]